MAAAAKRRKGRLSPSQARSARRERRNRRKRVLRFAAFSLVSAIAFLFIVSLFAGSLPISIGSEGEPPGERITGVRGGLGDLHIDRGSSPPDPYTSVPATSGYHYSDSRSPAAWGVYTEVLPDEVLVHNLEHGGIGIHYDCPDGCDELVAQLVDVAKGTRKVIVSPYPGLDTTIALTAWTYLDKFDEFDKERVENFILGHVSSLIAPEGRAP